MARHSCLKGPEQKNVNIHQPLHQPSPKITSTSLFFRKNDPKLIHQFPYLAIFPPLISPPAGQQKARNDAGFRGVSCF
jgi:hypothetical protein